MIIKASQELLKLSGIYQIKNIVNDKKYIGSAKNFQKRINTHLYLLRKDRHHSGKLQEDFNYFGEDNFEFSILELVNNKHELLKYEQKWLDLFDSSNKGYNILDLATPNPVLYGYKNKKSKEVICVNTGELFGSVAEAGRAKDISYSTIASCCRHSCKSAKNLIWLYTEEWNTLKDKEKEYYYQMALCYKEEKRKYTKHYKEYYVRKIRCIEQDIVFNSALDGAKFINQINGGHILECCRGLRKTCGRYHWEYADLKENNNELS